MKNLLLLCPTARERRDMPAITRSLGVNLIYDDFAGDYFDNPVESNGDAIQSLDILSLISKTIEVHRRNNLSGITSAVGYPGMSVVAVMAKELALPGPDPEPIMLCEHKYYSRVRQREIVPQATADFVLIDPEQPLAVSPNFRFPAFLKPVKSYMSMNAFRIKSRDELGPLVKDALLPDHFIKPFNDMVQAYTNWELKANYLLLEELLEGHQISLEGYVFQGQPVVMGIIDSIMFPGTFSFKRFQYPSNLPQAVQEQMQEIAISFLKGIGYDNAMFNMEMIYNPRTKKVHIIEINPKIASQFPSLFEMVDGTSSYTIMLQIALGETPMFSKCQGKHKVSASCVLRTFEDKLVLAVPSKENIQEVIERFPGTIVETLATVGKKLSDQAQDTQSYRYGLIYLGADSEEELLWKFDQCQTMLRFKWAPV